MILSSLDVGTTHRSHPDRAAPAARAIPRAPDSKEALLPRVRVT
jgi:hypothetical protein